VAAFESFMNSLSWVDVGLLLLVFGPLYTLVHELGHAAVPLTRTEGFVFVQVGREPARWRLRIGRLVLHLDPLPSSSKIAGYARSGARLGPGERAVYALSGPAASGLFSLALVVAGRRLGAPVLELAGWLGFSASVINLVPHRVGRLRSDGWHLLQALAGHGTGQSDVRDTPARVEVLLANSADSLTERRKRLLGGVPVLLGLSPEKPTEEGFTLVRIAFVGWCWRESQRDRTEVREAALDALHEATRVGLVEPSLTGFAAQRLAESHADFGAVFDDGFAYACRHDSGDREQFAFRFGGALREIERIRS
jgi:hypothetical protein